MITPAQIAGGAALVALLWLPGPALAQHEPEPPAVSLPAQSEPVVVCPAPADPDRPEPAHTFDTSGPFGGGFSPLFNPVLGEMPFRATFRATWFPNEPVLGQPTHLGYVEEDFSTSFPLWQDCANEWSFTAGVRSEQFNTQAILPDTHQPFPQDLWSVRFGTMYRHLFDNGWIGGGTVTTGSASDRPFSSIRDMTIGFNSFLRIPQGEANAWLFTLSYSTTSELPIPLPGVAYVWQPSSQFRANIGLPFQVMWRPCDALTFDFSYMLLTTVHARATYRLCKRVRFYAGYDWQNETYLLADRINTTDRFFYLDQRVSAGMQMFLCPLASLDLSSGYVFDRHYFEGRSVTSGTDFNRVDVGDGPFLSLQFLVRW
jgi:hypothetical protein